MTSFGSSNFPSQHEIDNMKSENDRITPDEIVQNDWKDSSQQITHKEQMELYKQAEQVEQFEKVAEIGNPQKLEKKDPGLKPLNLPQSPRGTTDVFATEQAPAEEIRTEELPPGVDPLSAIRLSNGIPEGDSRVVGAYRAHGSIFVFVDSKKAHDLYASDTKRLAYDFRFNLNMPNSGIEQVNAPYPLYADDKPESPLGNEGTYRVLYQLNMLF